MDIRKFFNAKPSKKPANIKTDKVVQEKPEAKLESGTPKKKESESASIAVVKSPHFEHVEDKVQKLQVPEAKLTPGRSPRKRERTPAKQSRENTPIKTPRRDATPSKNSSSKKQKITTNVNPKRKRKLFEEDSDIEEEVQPKALSPPKTIPIKTSPRKRQKKPKPPKGAGDEISNAKVGDPNEDGRVEITTHFGATVTVVGAGGKFKPFGDRHSPPNLHSKRLPSGEPNCLAGKSFLFSGVFDSTPRDEMLDLLLTSVNRHGGEVKKGLSGAVKYLVFGVIEVGLKKIEQISTKPNMNKVKLISEDEILEMIASSAPTASTNTENPAVDKVEKKDTICLPPPSTAQPAVKSQFENISNGLKVTQALIDSVKDKSNTDPQDAVLAVSHTHSSQLWVDKYKPEKARELIGNETNVKRLRSWLMCWHDKVNKKGFILPGDLQGLSKGKDGGPFCRAVLLSGPPGIGKTTAAHVIPADLGYNVMEFNASDTRSRKMLQSTLFSLSSNRTINDFFSGSKRDTGSSSSGHFQSTKPVAPGKTVIIMDEVDGMAGNEDRGGVGELITIIKQARVPIICVCNDEWSQRVRSLIGSTFHLKFRKPTAFQIVNRLQEILRAEKWDFSNRQALERLAEATNYDVRQIFTLLQMWRRSGNILDYDSINKRMEGSFKELDVGFMEAGKSLLPGPERQALYQASSTQTPIEKQIDMYFHDYDMVPLVVQENYIFHNVDIECLEVASQSLSDADIIDQSIRSRQNYQLLPVYGVISSVIPTGAIAHGRMAPGKWVQFPSLLGQTSKQNGRNRLLQEIHKRTSLTIPTGLTGFRDYLPVLRDRLSKPLELNGKDGAASVVDFLTQYKLAREDMDSIAELCNVKNEKTTGTINPQAKAAVTRKLKAGHFKLNVPVKGTLGYSKKRSSGFEDGQDDDVEDKGSDDEISGLVVKPKKSASKPKKTNPKGKGKGKGKILESL